MKNLFSFNKIKINCFFFLIIFNVNAQVVDCDRLSNWISVVENEVSSNDEPNYERIQNNLFSDKYFKPFFQKSFQELSLANKNRFIKKINKCEKKLDAKQTNNLSSYTKKVFTQEEYSRALIRKIKKINSLRKKHQIIEDKLDNSKTLSEFDFYNFQQTLRSYSDFSALFPSEVNNLKTKIRDAKKIYSEISAAKLADEILIKENSLETIISIRDYRGSSIYYELIDLSPEKLNEINLRLKEKEKEIFNPLMKLEVSKLNDIGNGQAGIIKSKTLYNNFKSKYWPYYTYSSVKKTRTLIENKRLILLQSQKQVFLEEVSNVKTKKELTEIEEKYLVGTPNYSIEEYNKHINSKLELIKLSAKQDAVLLEKNKKIFLSEKGFEYKSPKFWTKYGSKVGHLLKNIFNGNFDEVKNDFYFQHLYTTYVYNLSYNCQSILPKNKKDIIVIYKSSNAVKNGVLVTGMKSMPFIDTYANQTSITKVKVTIDPQFEEGFRSYSSKKVKNVARNIIYNAIMNRSDGLDDMYELINIDNFLRDENCNEKSLKQLGKNILNFSEGKESIQAESGL